MKKRFFFLLPAAVPNIDDAASLKVFLRFMIVCSCNVLSDHDVRHAVNTADDAPRNAKQIYDCLGCSAECGRCARTIKTIIDEALGYALSLSGRLPAPPDHGMTRRMSPNSRPQRPNFPGFAG